jgi:hypothetical protein
MKLTKKNSTEKTQMEPCSVLWFLVCVFVCLREKKAKNQRSRFLQAYENKNILHT